MKPALFVFLALSLIANIALALKLRTPSPATGPSDTHVSSPPGNPRPEAAANTTSAGGVTKVAASASTPIAGIDWATLGADGDLKQLVARLRAAGFPTSVIRAILFQEITERSLTRRKELLAKETPYEYWKNRSAYQADQATMAARREIFRDNERQLKELLGADARRDDVFTSTYMMQQFGNLPRDKIEQIQLISSDYQDLSSQIRLESQGMTLPEDRQKLAYLENEKLKDIASLLTPEEFEEYQLRTSPSAQQLRSQMTAGFEPTEQEFRALFKLQQAFDEKYSFSTGTQSRGAAGMQQRQDAEKQLLEDAKALLGAERGAQFERSRDYSYRAAVTIARRHELAPGAADAVWAAKTDAEQRAAPLRSLPAAERQAQLAAIQQETIAKVTTALGQKGYNSYKDSGGYWIQNLNPPVAPPRK